MDRLEIKASISVDDAGAITGTAWPFGSADRVGDVIEKGAFTSPARLPMLFAHDQAQAIGVWDSIEETAEGLTVKGRLLIDDVARAREVRALVREGAVTGLSIGFVTKKAIGRKGGGRTISALDLHEISIVPVPSHNGARITLAKSLAATEGRHMPQTEQEAAPDFAAFETKLAEVAGEVKSFGKLVDRMDRIEAKLARPASNDNAKPTNDNVETKAFELYLRSSKSPDFDIKTLRVSNDVQGGYFAPAEFSLEFIRDLVLYSPIRSIASVKPTVHPSVSLLKRTAITNAKWKGELQDAEESEPVFGGLEIPTREINTYVDISNQLLQDSVADVNAEVRLALAEDFGQKEGLAFVSGTGPLQPQGLLTSSAVPVLTIASSLTSSMFIDAFYNLPAFYRNRATWIMNGTTLAAVRKLVLTTGEFIWQRSFADGQPETIGGRPVLEVPDMPDIASGKSPIMLGDFQTGYRIIDRIELSTLINPYILATQGATRIHATRRVGADVIQPKALRKLTVA